MAAHKHAEVIKAWADGAQVQMRIGDKDHWKDSTEPTFMDEFEYRIKPAEPEREPLLAMSNWEIEQFFQCYPGNGRSAAVATVHEAVQRSLNKGWLISKYEFDRAIGDRKARDLAVANAVALRCYWNVSDSVDADKMHQRITESVLEDVIAKLGK